MSIRSFRRGSAISGVATPTNAPAYVDSTTNQLKSILGGSGTTQATLTGPITSVEAKTASFTLTAADHGKLFLIDAADVVVTLPATVAGLAFTFLVKTVSTTTGLSISPAAADYITSSGLTEVDNKDLINTAATDELGDLAAIVGDGVDGWFVTSLRGTWAKEA